MKTPTLEEQVEEFDDELTKIGYREREGKITLLEAQKLEDKAIRQALLTAEKRGVEKAVKCFPEPHTFFDFKEVQTDPKIHTCSCLERFKTAITNINKDV